MRHGANASKGISPTDPPVFDPSQDHQEWRRNIARWVDTISSAAEKGSDRMYKTVFATLANQLYDRGLPSAQKSIVDEAQANGSINYKQSNQIEAVKQIMELIAVDPPMAIVSRLITSFNQVTNCRRGRNEDLGAFVSRFRGLAADHLMHGGLSPASQVGEVLAITLLNNANLSEDTLSNAKIQLINHAEARQQKEEAEMVKNIRYGCTKEMFDKLKAMTGTVGRFKSQKYFEITDETDVDDSANRVKNAHRLVKFVDKTLTEFVDESKQTTDANGEPIKDVVVPTTVYGSVLLQTKPRCRLNLDDAVIVLQNLSFSPGNDQRTYTKSELQTIIGKEIQTAMLSYASNQKGNKSNVPDRTGSTPPKKYRKAKNPPKGDNRNEKKRPREESEFCKDCGSNEHSRGSDECKTPSFYTKKLKSEGRYTGDGSSTADQKKGNGDRGGNQGFRQGSNPTKRKHH